MQKTINNIPHIKFTGNLTPAGGASGLLHISMKENQFVKVVKDVKEIEKTNSGKALHDNINQRPGASRLYLQLAKKGDESLENYLMHSSEYTLTAVEDIKRLTKGLTTGNAANFGLWQAIDQLAHDTMQMQSIKIYCAPREVAEAGLEKEFKINLYKIVQEQINNILKHAHAKQVIITLSKNKLNVTLGISDDGIGSAVKIEKDSTSKDNIRKYAWIYNGAADFVSRSRVGCRLMVKFPTERALVKKM